MYRFPISVSTSERITPDDEKWSPRGSILPNARTLSEAHRRAQPNRSGARGAGALSIRPFQVSRWRLRRTWQLWVFNAVLVLPHRFLVGILACRVAVCEARSRWYIRFVVRSKEVSVRT